MKRSDPHSIRSLGEWQAPLHTAESRTFAGPSRLQNPGEPARGSENEAPAAERPSIRAATILANQFETHDRIRYADRQHCFVAGDDVDIKRLARSIRVEKADSSYHFRLFLVDARVGR